MSVTLKDLIHEFASEQKPDAVPGAAPEAETPAYDGATALLVTEFLDAVEALCAVLEEESACIAVGMLDRLEVFAHRKAAMAERLESVANQARADGVRLPDDLRAMTLDRIERLDRAVTVNATGLVALRKAVLTINRNLLAALEKAASDGTYARSGHSLRPVELSASGLNTTL
ncbi:flagellar protein FlgN [Azospirillum doebereinerae]|uniref:Flagellar protein FlgN n=1 Tax=Azospirillum doebereinerae TaxID=92933 RepID=A0A433J3Y9_9PROT|nr:flagellar protein FlgN [Azospirillum doebereinerae]RUQ66559.1 flagellar protein FlgN [Azospirillum doebereinerae]